MFLRLTAIALLLTAATSLAAQETPKTGGTQPAPAPVSEVLDEISDSAGVITKAKVLGIGDKEILIKDPVTGADKKIAVENLIFVRTASGKYYFFFQQETPASANSSAPAKSAASGKSEFEITAGFAGHFANNDAVGAYTNEYATFLVTSYNQKIGTGFARTTADGAAALHWQFFAEPRLNYENFILGLSIGYAGLPKTSSVVSSAGQNVQSTINLNGQFFPIAFIFYYRLIADGPLGLNLGFGAGALYSTLRMSIVGGPAENKQILTSINPMLVFKPELTYKFGAVRLLLSLPVYWAEARDVTDGEETLIQINSRNIVAPSLTGIGVMFAVGIQL